MKKLLSLLLALLPTWAIASQSTISTPIFPDIGTPNTTIVKGTNGSVRQYLGADGLTNAFYYCNDGDTLFIGPGTYVLKAYKNTNVAGSIFGTLQTSNRCNLTILGYGATIKTTNYGTAMSHIGVSNLYIGGLTFDGTSGNLNITNYTNVSFNIEYAICTGANYDYSRRVHNVTIDNCKFYDIPDQAISFVYGGCWNGTIKNCHFYNVGHSNIWNNGYSGPDGACASGIAFPGFFINNYMSNCVYGYEIDGTLYEPGTTPMGHWVCRDNYFDAICDMGVMFGNNAWTMRGIYIENNVFRFDNRNTHQRLKDGSTWAAVAGVFGFGNVSDVVIRGNTFGGLTNFSSAQAHIAINDSMGTNSNFLVEGNSFLTNMSVGICMLYVSGSKYQFDNMVFRNNFFDNTRLPCMSYVGNTTWEGNIFKGWCSTYEGNTVGALWLRETLVTNIVIRGNTYTPTNAACYAWYALSCDPSVKFHYNEFRGPTVMTAPFGSSWSLTNTSYMHMGAGAPPSLAVQVGSVWHRTDYNDVTALYTKTNNTTTWRAVMLK